jgi:hypothetical protein
MTTIVAGVFETEAAAARAAEQLRRAGFERGDLDQFVLSPPGRHHQLPLGGDEAADPKAQEGGAGAVTGAAIGSAVGAVAGAVATPFLGPAAIPGGLAAGAYVGSLAGAVNNMHGASRGADPVTRPAGVMLAVNTEFGEDEEVAVDLMRDAGARMIERADGAWRDGRWADFDPVRPPQVVEQKAA